jgi:hypothetical protein
VQTPVVLEVKVTGVKPVEAVALTVPVTTTTIVGAVPKVIVWLPLPTVKVCVCVAEL